MGHLPTPLAPSAIPDRRHGDEACAARVEDFSDRLVEGDARGAEAIVEQLLADGAAAEVVLARLVQPAMTRIGELWECAEATVADEHLATTIAHQVIATLYERLLVAPIDSRGRVLLASAENDHHALGLRMAADVLEGGGYQVVYLGADVPTQALLAAVARHRPAVVGLSVTLPSSAPAVDEAVAAIAEHAPNVHVVVGGGAAGHVRARSANLHVVPDVTELRAVVDSIEPAAARAPEHRPVIGPTGLESTRGDDYDRAALYEGAMARAGDLARLHARRAQQFRTVAFQDALTGLSNRRAFDDRILELVGVPAQLPLAMLMLDIDSFKQVNDVHGHQVGDAALQQTAACIEQELRADDFAARLGGDEFVVLLPSTALDDAIAVAERIRASIEETAQPPFTVSIGVEQCNADIRASILGADTSLYRAKGSGRNTVCTVA